MFRTTSGRLAGALLVGLLLGPAAGAPAQDTQNPYTALEDVETGERLFRAHCSRCHGFDATGGETGPSLKRGRFRRAQSDAGLFKVIAEGVADTEMPPIYRTRGDDSVWRLVAYLRSINQRPDNVSLPGDAASGGRLYAGQGDCASCHMLGGMGGLQGPDLSTIGERRSPDELRADLLDPDHEVEPRWYSVRATYDDGRTLEGIRMNEDTYSYRLLDADENLWSVSKRDLRASERIELSTMPSYESRLTNDEVEDLVAYLYSLRREER